MRRAPGAGPPVELMKVLPKLFPWFLLALFGAEMVAVLLPRKDGEYHVNEFGRLPVQLNGRVQPFDSAARNALLQIRGTGAVPLEEAPAWRFWRHGRKLNATEWLLEVAARPEVADTRPAFLIHHAELLGELRLQDKGVRKAGLRYYTFAELQPFLGEINEQALKAGEVKSAERTAFQKQVLKLANALELYQRLKFALQPAGVPDFARMVADFQRDLGPALAAAQASQSSQDFDRQALERIAEPRREFRRMARWGYIQTVPPAGAAQPRDRWQTLGVSLLESDPDGQVHPAALYLATMATAYGQRNPEAFNSAVAGYRQWLAPRCERELRKGRAEFYFNRVKPFLHALIIYLGAFLLAGGALLAFALSRNWSEALRRSAFYLVLLAGTVHTFGLVFRMALEGRPPVTNLYSSAIFIGWGVVLLGLILERLYRVALGSVVAAFAGFVSLIIAHNLALGGDTMEMLRAVLDSNFWLTAHVVTITLGYSATFAAGLLAALYLLLGVLTPLLAQPLGAEEAGAPAAPGKTPPLLGQALETMVYGIVCFATLFNFLGTVLGGIWADQAWGRFWGWDPKENGALMVVLWNAFILHVRSGRLLRERGFMGLVVFGNIVTSFSWFGVNLLGVGLHSYGFMESGLKWLLFFMGSQLAIILVGLLPLRRWRSFRAGAGSPPAG